MRSIMILVSISLCLNFGCALDEPEPPPGDPAKDDLGQVEQAIGGPCRQNYECPLGERCDLSQPHPLGSGSTWTCQPYAVFGPSVNPCVDTLQCQYQWYWFSYCDRPPWASYGECKLSP